MYQETQQLYKTPGFSHLFIVLGLNSTKLFNTFKHNRDFKLRNEHFVYICDCGKTMPIFGKNKVCMQINAD